MKMAAAKYDAGCTWTVTALNRKDANTAKQMEPAAGSC